MAWKGLAGAAAAPILPPAERLQKLAHAEQLFASKFPNVRTVTAKEAAALLQQQPAGYVLVDVRNNDEQQVSMLQPGQPASVLTQQQFEQQKAQLGDKTAICYCTVGYRSGLYAQELQQQGIPAINLIGGICAWTQEGLPLAAAAGDGSSVQTNKVHTYSARWAYHGEGYTPVYYGNEYVRMLQDQLSKLGRRLFGKGGSSSSSSSSSS
ncbi:hypothetical protein OEZ85_000168 [Tetradesmus obliquus]|uniref:Rhodanese domain-containing protein n=1 Tax=Tetradesmus obliquus TaxID=3088 RepID=A0ABY8UQ81_TETOB|nr:hypothetical protein OEZ85_000168 [Tetradesmus obliquus]